MSYTIRNLKPWSFVKDKNHDISIIKSLFPEDYLYQLNGEIYYPAIKLSDIPKSVEFKFAY